MRSKMPVRVERPLDARVRERAARRRRQVQQLPVAGAVVALGELPRQRVVVLDRRPALGEHVHAVEPGVADGLPPPK
jgi:hypothetical protein